MVRERKQLNPVLDGDYPDSEGKPKAKASAHITQWRTDKSHAIKIREMKKRDEEEKKRQHKRFNM